MIFGTSQKTDGDMRIEQNRDAFFIKNHIDPQNVVLVKQIHGNRIVDVEKKINELIEADGMTTVKRDLVLAVLTADCVPVMIFDSQNEVCGTVHVGWRGVISGIVQNLIQKIEQKGGARKNLKAIIGSHIGACCYDVSKQRADQFRGLFKTDIVSQSEGKWYVDLGKAVFKQLETEGLPKENITAPIYCTSCDSTRYFSYRRDSKDSFGEMVSFVGIK